MRISTIAGFDAGVSTVSNTNNFVLDSSSNTPNSLVEFEDMKENISGDSVTPVVMSEIAHVDLGLDQTPSMIETQSRLTGIFSSSLTSMEGLYATGTKRNNSVMDVGGTHTVYAFGKFAENELLMKELFVKYNGDVNVDPEFISIAKNFSDAFAVFRRCYSVYTAEEKNRFMTGDKYIQFRTKMRGIPECSIDLSKINLIDEDLDYFSRVITSRRLPEIDYCNAHCPLDYQHCGFYTDFQRHPWATWQKGDEAKKRLDAGVGSKQDIDDAIGLKVLGMYSNLMNAAVCEVFTKCSTEINSTYDNKYKPKTPFSKDPVDIRASLIRDVRTGGNGRCDYFTWESEDRSRTERTLKFIRNEIQTLSYDLRLISNSFEGRSPSNEQLEQIQDKKRRIEFLEGQKEKLLIGK